MWGSWGPHNVPDHNKYRPGQVVTSFPDHHPAPKYCLVLTVTPSVLKPGAVDMVFFDLHTPRTFNVRAYATYLAQYLSFWVVVDIDVEKK